jgi:hypothetical protein
MKAADSPPATFLRALALLAVALLAGCGGSKRIVCPGTVVAPDVDRIAQTAPQARELRDIAAAAKIENVSSKCSGEKEGIAVNTHINFLLVRRDFDVKRSDFPYFVAVADASRRILNKQVFRLDQEFVPRQNSRAVGEDITAHIPMQNTADGGNYVVIVGFQLTPEQLEFNRKERGP